MNVHKLNESYSVIDADKDTLRKINDYLKVERLGAYFEPAVKAGFKSPYTHFGSAQNGKLLVMNGHLQLLSQFGVASETLQSDYNEKQLDDFVNDVKQILPFPPYDYQITAFKESILNVKQINKMCTGSGKSMTISLIAEFLRRQGKKGLLLVPNINLLTQFKNDIKDYNLHELYDDTHTIGGGSTDRNFNSSLTISTWQSMLNWHDELDKLDYVITDEAHRFASEETSAIVQKTVNCKNKWGFTGTLPEDPVMKMQLFGLFGLPKTYITSGQLISRGLATPIKINSIIFKYDNIDKGIFKEAKVYTKQLKLIKDHEARNEFIVNLTCKLRGKGNTLVLFQHTDHGKGLFLDTMKSLYPDVEVKNKDITGKNSYQFQEQYGIYFLNGEDDAKTRENTRRVLEEDIFNITLENNKVITLNGKDEVLLINGSKKIVKDLTEDDEIDDNFLESHKEGKMGPMSRWHFDNCRNKNEN